MWVKPQDKISEKAEYKKNTEFLKVWPQITQKKCLEFLESSAAVADLVFLLPQEFSKSFS